jgi:hypothetical protein
MLAQAPGDPDHAKTPLIEPRTLVAMFRAAAPRGKCPTADMLADRGFLRSTLWVRDMMACKTPSWEPAQRQVVSALKTLSKHLPDFIAEYRDCIAVYGKFAIPHPFDRRSLAVLECLNEIVLDSLAAAQPFSVERVRRPAWHLTADLIALDAMEAWRRAGRTQFGCNQNSPLVNFVQAFLAHAGVDQEHGTIAKHFQRSWIIQAAKQPTTSKPQL